MMMMIIVISDDDGGGKWQDGVEIIAAGFSLSTSNYCFPGNDDDDDENDDEEEEDDHEDEFTLSYSPSHHYDNFQEGT